MMHDTESFVSPSKNLRGLKANDKKNEEEVINDFELAQRKADQAAGRRYEAAGWLREMDKFGRETLPKEPSEEDFRLALLNGLILCNVLNKIIPGAIPKVVDNRVVTVQSTEGAAQSAIQYFENMRNFLLAVGNMKLLTFEASVLEKGGSCSKVVDCILCLKGYYKWKQAGGVGVWRYGGTVKIISFPKDCSSSSIGSESADELSLFDEFEASQHEQLSEFFHISSKVSSEESEAAKALALLFDRFGLRILQAFISEKSGNEDLSLNSMIVDIVIRKVVKDLSAMLVSHGVKLGLILKKILKSETSSLSNDEYLKVISQYLRQRNAVKASDEAEFCVCGGRREVSQKGFIHAAKNKEIIDDHQKQLSELKYAFEETKLVVKKVQSEWDDEVKKLESHVRCLEVSSSSYHKILEENRQLYNQVQDLKGAIRVYCRVRPFIPGQGDGMSTIDYIGENGNIMIVHPHKQGRDARKVFSFNKVFETNVTQQKIYADTQPLIRSVLDGYNVCIFAYGQTGSGKTYTMSGPDLSAEDSWGVNYRALQDLFQISKSRADIIDYEVRVQMIEIYNEQVRDLLVVDGSSRRLEIRNNSQLNGLNVPDASLAKVSCTQDVLDFMRIGLKNRSVGATALNERSSRSHSILTVHVQGKELLSGSILRACLHLVDLAGSERVDKSEAVGERLKEAQHLNKSLSALGDVISALAQKSTHIPYRNSKLTQVLQDSLGGQAKTLMFVHINPETNALQETISTLKFAERVASIELGAARANKETTELRDLKSEISNLKTTLEMKEAELEQLKRGNIRSNSEYQKPRAVSPMHVPRFAGTLEDKAIEVRSSSSGKQRRPCILSETETIPRMPFIAEEKSITRPENPRSISPPVRRSLSTDRGALVRSRLKPEMTEKPISRPQFPFRISVNKSIPPTENHSQTQEAFPQEIVDEQVKHVLNVRQMAGRKSKAESKPKMRNQVASRNIPRIEESFSLLSDMDSGGKVEDARNEPENELLGPPVCSNSKLKKLHKNSTRFSQYLEPRELPRTIEAITSGKTESKIPSSTFYNEKDKDRSNNSMIESRRSRSTPRGKFFNMP